MSSFSTCDSSSSHLYDSSLSSSVSSLPSSLAPDDDPQSPTNLLFSPSIPSPVPSPLTLAVLNLTPRNPLTTTDDEGLSPSRSAPSGFRPSPSMSVLPYQVNSINRTRANSLTHSSLAERRGSKTSAYLGTPDFKQNFASKLQSVRARERTLSGGNAPLPASNPPKPSSTWSFPNTVESEPSNSSFSRDFSFNRTRQPVKKLSCSGPSEVPIRGEETREMIDHLLALPTEELAAQLEIHFNRLEPGRDAEELKARNEVISTLADQLANLLETNDKLIFDLACLRSAHADLSSELADARDELSYLYSKSNPLDQDQLGSLRRESESQIRDLRVALEESKQAIARLRLQQSQQDRRRSLQTYQTALGLTHPHTRSSLLILGPDRHHLSLKRLSLSGASTLGHAPHSNRPKPNKDSALAQTTNLPSVTTKPARPPRSAARSGPISPVLAHDHPRAGSSEKEELELLRLQCTQLKIELNESEDSRLASQAALDGLKNFIASTSPIEVSNVKLPPLPTEPELNLNSKPRWGNLLTRSFGNTSPPSPKPMATFSTFSMWGRKPPREIEDLPTGLSSPKPSLLG